MATHTSLFMWKGMNLMLDNRGNLISVTLSQHRLDVVSAVVHPINVWSVWVVFIAGGLIIDFFLVGNGRVSKIFCHIELYGGPVGNRCNRSNAMSMVFIICISCMSLFHLISFGPWLHTALIELFVHWMPLRMASYCWKCCWNGSSLSRISSFFLVLGMYV
jgi:hypothetical protein